MGRNTRDFPSLNRSLFPVSLVTCNMHLDIANRRSGDPAARYVAGEPLQIDNTIERIFKQVKNQMNNCLQQHECCVSRAVRFLLRRVIDVGLDFGGSGLCASVKIYETQVGNQGQYVALSYCWGGPQEIQLNNTNHCEFNQTLPLGMLSQIIHAIKITRRLELRYL